MKQRSSFEGSLVVWKEEKGERENGVDGGKGK